MKFDKFLTESIWSDISQYEDSMPFFGFVAIPHIKGDILTIDFPNGYTPNGDATKEVAGQIARLLNAKGAKKINDTQIQIKLDMSELASYILEKLIEDL